MIIVRKPPGDHYAYDNADAPRLAVQRSDRIAARIHLVLYVRHVGNYIIVDYMRQNIVIFRAIITIAAARWALRVMRNLYYASSGLSSHLYIAFVVAIA